MCLVTDSSAASGAFTVTPVRAARGIRPSPETDRSAHLASGVLPGSLERPTPGFAPAVGDRDTTRETRRTGPRAPLGTSRDPDEPSAGFLSGDAIWKGVMATGTVDFFNDTGGYGFIETDESDEDVFFHMEDVGGPDLEEGQEVEFEIQDSPKGPRAANLTRL